MPTPARARRSQRDVNDLSGLRTGPYFRVSLADKQDKRKPTMDEERSTGTQRRIYEEWAARIGVITADSYADPDMSASRFAASKNRPEFERMVADVKAGKLDVLWFWEISRSQRRLEVFAELRNICRDQGVLWVIRDRVADPANSGDMLLAGIQSMISEEESEKLSVRVIDGKESAALEGKPAGRPPYGYRRIYNPETGERKGDVPDMHDGNGHAVQDSPAYIVKEIFARIAGGESVTAMRRDLTARKIPIPGGGRRNGNPGWVWALSTINYLATNPAYIGRRVYRIREHGRSAGSRANAILEGVTAQWPALVDEETFWTVQNILTSPVLPDGHPLAGRPRKTTRNGPRSQRWLLSAIATCAECGAKLIRKSSYQRHSALYFCRDNSCVGTPADELDAYAEELIIDWLSDPKRGARLMAGGDTAAAKQARADAERTRSELAQLYREVEEDLVSAQIATIRERRLKEAIADAEQREQAATLPAVLKGVIGRKARAGWEDTPMAGRRLIVSTVASIQVHRIGRNAGFPGHRPVHPAYRVGWRWLLPPPGEYIAPLDFRPVVEEARRQRQMRQMRSYVTTEQREQIARLLRADPEATDRTIRELVGDKGGRGVPEVRRELEEAGDIPVIRRQGRGAAVNHGYQPRSAT
jgi:DNA invertase Pin-like site-specific DNA recombinase